jgi:hypothetical protein
MFFFSGNNESLMLFYTNIWKECNFQCDSNLRMNQVKIQEHAHCFSFKNELPA